MDGDGFCVSSGSLAKAKRKWIVWRAAANDNLQYAWLSDIIPATTS